MSDNPIEVTVDDSTPPPVERKRGRRIGVALAAVAVVAGGLFAALSLSSESNSPDDPVRAMFESAEKGDVLGVLEQLDPGERDAIRQPLIDIVGELNRLEVLKDADLGKISGLELHVDDLKLTTDRLGDGVARIKIAGGTGSYRVEVAKLPLGRFVRDLLGDSNNEVNSGSDSLKSTSDNDFVATVRRGDRWYVSIGYSIAEQARGDRPFDQMGPALDAKGADSPEDAVRQMIQAGAGLDVRRMLELLPPDEMAAVHEYAGLFLAEAESGAADARADTHITIPTLELDSDTHGDEALVTIKKIEVEAQGEFGTFSVKDGCFHFSGEDIPARDLCPGDNPTDALGVTPFGLFGDPTQVTPPKLSFTGKTARVGIVTTKVDGQWYVSPVRTVLDDLVAVMRLAEPHDLDEIRDYFDRLTSSFDTSFSGGTFSCYSSDSGAVTSSAEGEPCPTPLMAVTTTSLPE